MTNAEHILEWCLNSREHWNALRDIRENRNSVSATIVASSCVSLANRTYRDMKPDRDEYTAGEILEAARLMEQWEPEA